MNSSIIFAIMRTEMRMLFVKGFDNWFFPLCFPDLFVMMEDLEDCIDEYLALFTCLG